MISKQTVEDQLKRIGFSFKFFNRAEVGELGKIMIEDEVIAECVNGEYTQGFALLVATNHRVLIVDKKPMLYLTVEDLRYDMITEFNYSHRMINATIRIFTMNKTLQFTSWNQPRLRRLLEYTQQRVLELRQQAHMAQQFQAAAAAQYAQLHAANYYQPQPNFAPNLAAQPPAPAQYAPANDANAGSTAQSAAQPQYVALPPAQAPMPEQEPHQPAGHNGIAGINPQAIVSRFAAKRAALGTYTRSKLPSFRHHHDHADNITPAPQSGEVYPQGFQPGQPVTNYGIPYQY